jgi:hypothetical protein
MNVYEVNPDISQFEWLLPFGTDGKKWLDYTWGDPCGEHFAPVWSSLKFSSPVVGDEDYPLALPKGDFVGIATSHITLTPRAMASVGKALSRCGELLPIEHVGHSDPLYWFHCTTLIDAMDERLSFVRRLPSGKINEIPRLWVYPERLRDVVLFHIPQNGSRRMCTDTFKQHIETLGLTGLKFTLRWSDEPAGLKYVSSREPRELYKMPPFPVPIP